MGHYNDIIREDREAAEEKKKKALCEEKRDILKKKKEDHNVSIAIKIRELIEHELSYARSSFEPMHSAHEGYATLKEELEELQSEVKNMADLLDYVWASTKQNSEKTLSAYIENMHQNRIHLVHEAVQVAAMIERFKQDVVEKNEKSL